MMKTKTYSIYCIRNKTNGKRYVGYSCRPEWRMEGHRKNKYVIGNAIRKYGWDNFTKEILESGLTINEVQNQERFWIEKFNCIAPNGYNLNAGGEGGLNPSAETRTRMGKAQKGKKHTAEACAKMSGNTNSLGYKHSIETRTRMGKAQKGRIISIKHRAKISKAQKGKNNHEVKAAAKRQGLTVEKYIKQRDEKQAAIPKKGSPELRAKMSEAAIGRKHSAEVRAKISKAAKKRYENPEYCAKQSMNPIKIAAKRKGLTLKQYAKQKLPFLEKQLETTKSEQLLRKLPSTIKILQAILADN